MKNMFNNIGGKIKMLAGVTCALGMIASACGAIALWTQNSRYTPTIFLGVLVLGLGCLGSWVGSFFTYGFGQLIENTDNIHTDNMEIQRLLRKQNEDRTGSTSAVNRASTNTSKRWDNESTPTNEEWICPNCGLRNSRYVDRCINCDTKR